MTFSGVIRNSIIEDTTGVEDARFCIDNLSCLTSSTGMVGLEIVFGPLTAGGTQTVTSSASWSATSGLHEIWLCADVFNTEAESNETNNCSSVSFTVTVVEPLPTASLSASPTTIVQGDSSTLNWSSTDATSCTGSGFSTGGATSGSVVLNPGPSVTTTYSVSCDNGGFGSDIVTVRVPTTGITAAPSLIQPEGFSTVTWSASGVNSCTVSGTDGFSASSGDISGGGSWNSSTLAGPLTDQTTYTLSCVTNVDTHEDTAVINVNLVFEEF